MYCNLLACKNLFKTVFLKQLVVIWSSNLLLHYIFILLHNDSRSDIYVAGRSNAINIAERLGLPGKVVDNARELYGAASAGIDEVTCIDFITVILINIYVSPYLLRKNTV